MYEDTFHKAAPSVEGRQRLARCVVWRRSRQHVALKLNGILGQGLFSLQILQKLKYGGRVIYYSFVSGEKDMKRVHGCSIGVIEARTQRHSRSSSLVPRNMSSFVAHQLVAVAPRPRGSAAVRRKTTTVVGCSGLAAAEGYNNAKALFAHKKRTHKRANNNWGAGQQQRRRLLNGVGSSSSSSTAIRASGPPPSSSFGGFGPDEVDGPMEPERMDDYADWKNAKDDETEGWKRAAAAAGKEDDFVVVGRGGGPRHVPSIPVPSISFPFHSLGVHGVTRARRSQGGCWLRCIMHVVHV